MVLEIVRELLVELSTEMWNNESAEDPLVCIRVVFAQDLFSNTQE